MTDAKLHHHDAECQGGRVCSLADGKEPTLPSLDEILRRL